LSSAFSSTRGLTNVSVLVCLHCLWKTMTTQDAGAAWDVNLYNDDDLRAQWRTTYRGTQREFCAAMGLNCGNFSMWLAGKRHTSPASAAAVRRYLHQTLSLAALYPERKSITEQELEQEVIERASELRAIVYIDGAHAAAHMDSLLALLSPQQRAVMVVCVLAKDVNNTVALAMQHGCTWFFPLHALSTAKEATDQAVVYLAMAHHFLLHDRPDVSFVLISRGRFVPEPKERLEARGRVCFTADGFSATPALELVSFGIPLEGLLTPNAQSLLEPFLKIQATSDNTQILNIRQALMEATLSGDELQGRVARKLLGPQALDASVEAHL